jgi:tape measure domain-containing protein
MSAVNVGSIKITITGDNSSLRKAFRSSEQILDRFDNKAQRVSRRTSQSFSLIGKAAIAYIGVQIGQAAFRAGKSLIDTAAEVEKLKVALISMERDTAKGLKTFNELDEWAKNMPIRTAEAIDQYRRLTAMGLNPTKEKMELILDSVTALGGGTDTFRGIARALGQMASKGKVAGEEMRQLAEHGIPIYDILKKKLKLSGDQLRDMAKQGVDAQAGLEAIFRAMEERFGGTAQRMMTTWFGITELIKDRLWRLKRYIMESGEVPLFDKLKAALLTVVTIFDKSYKTMALSIGSFIESFLSGIWDLAYGGAQILDVLIPPMIKIYDNVLKPVLKMYDGLPDWVKTVGVVGAIFLGPQFGAVILGIGMAYDQIIKLASTVDNRNAESQFHLLSRRIEETNAEIEVYKNLIEDTEKSMANSPFVPQTQIDQLDRYKEKLKFLEEQIKSLGNAAPEKNWVTQFNDYMKDLMAALNMADNVTGRDFSKATDFMKRLEKAYNESLKKVMDSKRFNIKEMIEQIIGDYGKGIGGKAKDPFANLKDRLVELEMEQARMLGLFPEMHDEVWEIVKANEEWSLMAEDLTGYYLQLESKLSTIQEITDQINKKNDTWSNGIRDAIDNYLQGTKTIRERWEQFTTTTLGAFEQGMVDIFDSATKGFENWAEVVTNMLSTIYNEMIRIWVVKRLISGIGDALGAAPTTAKVPYTGTQTGRRRSVDSSMFATAPRLHNGLMADEFPAVLQKGETVLPKGVRAGGSVTVQIIDQRSQGAPVDVQESTGPGGERMIQVMVRDMVKAMHSDGSLDKTLSQNYTGIKRRSR